MQTSVCEYLTNQANSSLHSSFTWEQKFVQIIKNSRHTVEITELTPEGQGLATLAGLPVIVEQTIPGEVVEIKIIKVTGRLAVGKLNRVVKPAQERAMPFCPVFQRCGGCSLQHIRYGAQLALKTEMFKDSLQNIGQRENVVIHDMLGMPQPLHYRNKAQYPVGRQKGAAVIGFYANRSHEIIEHPACAVQAESLDRVKAVFEDFMVRSRLSVYDEERQEGLIRYLMLRVGMYTGEIMVMIVVNGNDFPGRKLLIQALTAAVPEIRSVVLNVNERHTNVILGPKYKVVYGQDAITDQLGGCQFVISPQSFYQVNPAQTEVLYRKIVEYAGLHGKETVVDLYSGIGTIALFLARQAQHVYGVENVPDAVNDARRNAKINSNKNVHFISGDAAQVMTELNEQGVRADVVVLDPPRKGCEARVLQTLVRTPPARIVYVSCNPAALAIDLRYLNEHGFRAAEVQPVDMFPHTAHVECVVRIERRK